MPSISATKKTVRIELPNDLPLLHADAVLIERVLANLFENAAKYTPAGDVDTLFQKFTRGDKKSSQRSMRAPTTISSSPARSASCWPACVPVCGAATGPACRPRAC